MEINEERFLEAADKPIQIMQHLNICINEYQWIFSLPKLIQKLQFDLNILQ